jgi:hypothetical protein
LGEGNTPLVWTEAFGKKIAFKCEYLNPTGSFKDRGSALIASFLCSRDGREAGAGGWGATLGDEGSGYWISLQAMTAVLQAHDGRIQDTALSDAVLKHFVSDAGRCFRYLRIVRRWMPIR